MNPNRMISDRQIPRPIEDLRDALRGRNNEQGAPMAPDVETVFSPPKQLRKRPKASRADRL